MSSRTNLAESALSTSAIICSLILRKRVAATVVVVEYPRRGIRPARQNVIRTRRVFGPDLFAWVMIETEMAAPHVRQVGEDVVVRHRNLAVLHILGMHKFDGAQYAQFFQKNGAHQSVKIAPSQESVFLRFVLIVSSAWLIGGISADL